MPSMTNGNSLKTKLRTNGMPTETDLANTKMFTIATDEAVAVVKRVSGEAFLARF